MTESSTYSPVLSFVRVPAQLAKATTNTMQTNHFNTIPAFFMARPPSKLPGTESAQCDTQRLPDTHRLNARRRFCPALFSIDIHETGNDS
jgi:hypothetical protein